jgi:UDP-2,3-diacylglucosamine pyrophosphatase LpxH
VTPTGRRRFLDLTSEPAVHAELSDDSLLVFLSDVHIGGAAGVEIFDSAAELVALLEDLGRHLGPVELVLVGDFVDLLRMGDPGRGEDLVAATLARPEYRDLFASLRAFAGVEGHRVVYVVGNHDAELWWNPGARQPLHEAGLVEAFALSYSAAFASLPDQVVYCEHGNQLDPTNTITDYANPLDTPVGAHVVTEVVRPIGSGAAITRSVDLQAVSYVFPLAAIPQWVAGRIFYQFLGQVLRWLLGPLIVAFAAYEALAAVVPPLGRSLGLRPVFLELAYLLALLAVAFVVLFLISRRTAARAVPAMPSRYPGQLPGQEPYREDVAIRRLLEQDRPPPMAGSAARRELAVFVSGHTHAPAISTLEHADGRVTVIVNTGCWLRQLQPVDALLGAPPVFVPTFVQSHVRVRAGQDSLTVELWDQPKPAGRRLPWIERAAIAGRMPPQPPPAAGPRLLARQVTARPVSGPS